MDNVKYREDGTPVIVVPFKLRHLGYKQTIVVDEQNRKLEDIAQEPLPRALILAHQYADMMESGKFSTVLELAQYLKSDRSHVARIFSRCQFRQQVSNQQTIIRSKQWETPYM